MPPSSLVRTSESGRLWSGEFSGRSKVLPLPFYELWECLLFFSAENKFRRSNSALLAAVPFDRERFPTVRHGEMLGSRLRAKG